MKTNERPLNNLDQIGSIPRFLIKGEGSLRLWESIASALSLVNSFLILTSLSLHQFGLYQLVLSLVTVVGGFNTDSLDGIVSVEMRRNLNQNKVSWVKKIFSEYFRLKILISFLLTAAVFIGSFWAANLYGDDIGLFLRLAAVVLIIEAVQSLQKILLKNAFSFDYFMAPAVREFSKLLLLGWFFFLPGLDIARVLYSHVWGWLISLAFTSVFFWKVKAKFFKNYGSPVKDLLLFPILKIHGRWVILRYGLARITKGITPWFIKFFVGTEGVALYSVAVSLVAMLEELFPVNMVSFLFLAKADSRKEIRHLFVKSIKYIFWFGLILGGLALIFVPPVVVWILPKYQPALKLFIVMLAAFPIYGVYKLIKSVLTGLREYKILTMRLVSEALVAVGSLIVFLPMWGIYGAAASYVLVYVARIYFLFPKLVQSHPYLRFRFADFLQFDNYDRDFFRGFWSYVSGAAVNFVSRKLGRKSK